MNLDNVDGPESSTQQVIPLGQMSQQAHARDSSEDWTGVSDAKSRRKLQNRLNQRAKRSRGPTLKMLRRIVTDAWFDMQRHPSESAFHIQRIEQVVAGRYMAPPTADLLLTLVQFNVFRALLDNTRSLGIPVDWVEDEAISSVYQGAFSALAPPNLQPTLVQRGAEHHPWIDVLPFPMLRDNIIHLAAVSESLEDELCGDIVGWCRSPGDRVGLVIWTRPWDPSGWEVTEGFLRKWGWIVADCWEVRSATNYWRALRGEDPFDIEALIQESLSTRNQIMEMQRQSIAD